MNSFLEDLQAAAHAAEAAETAFRRELAERMAGLERERAFAFRRVNLMKSVVEAVTSAEDEQMAVGYACAVLRARLRWDSESETRAAVLTHFTPVAQAIFADLKPSEEDGAMNVAPALAQFETWYAQTHPTPFWTLFDQYMPETPLVDF